MTDYQGENVWKQSSERFLVRIRPYNRIYHAYVSNILGNFSPGPSNKHELYATHICRVVSAPLVYRRDYGVVNG